tara:strand:- start:11061 stop:11258 length:198 start_codon:yes stop_codon:yes gene_type:complete
MDKETFVITKQDGSCLSAVEVEEVYDYLAVFLMKKGYVIRGGDVGRLNEERIRRNGISLCNDCED